MPRACSKCGLVAIPLLRGLCGGCYNGSRHLYTPGQHPRNYGRKLTEEQVITLRAEYRARKKAGTLQGFLSERAPEYGIDRRTLGNAVRGFTYRKVRG